MAALRRGETAAFHEFYARFAPALQRLAYRHRAVLHDLESIVTDTLTDGALALLPYTVPVPRSLAAYLTTALRNRILTVRRTHLRRHQRDVTAAADFDARGGEPVPVASSEDAWRGSAGPAWEPSLPSAALLRLVRHLEEGLTPTERAILVWIAHYVPQRTIAEWLGLRYDAVAKRVTRLRTRLRVVASRYAETLDAAERRELDAFFRRSGGAAPPAAPAADPATPSPVRHATRQL